MFQYGKDVYSGLHKQRPAIETWMTRAIQQYRGQYRRPRSISHQNVRTTCMTTISRRFGTGAVNNVAKHDKGHARLARALL